MIMVFAHMQAYQHFLCRWSFYYCWC